MANIGMGIMFPQAQAQQADFERQRRMAELMQQQSMQPDQTQAIGGVAIQNSPLQGLAKLLQGYGANKKFEDITQQENQAAGQQQKTMADMITGDNNWLNPDTNQVEMDDAKKKELLMFQADPGGYVKSKKLAELMAGGLGGETDIDKLAMAAVLNPELKPILDLKLAQQKDVGKTPPPGMSQPQWNEIEKGKAERINSLSTNTEGAKEFLSKVEQLQGALTELGSGVGPVQSSGLGRGLGNVFGTDNEKNRQIVDALLKDLELSVAKMELKGQGQVTEAERAIARGKLPSMSNQEDANNSIISNLKLQAENIKTKGEQFQKSGQDIQQFEQSWKPKGAFDPTSLSDDELENRIRALQGGQ